MFRASSLSKKLVRWAMSSAWPIRFISINGVSALYTASLPACDRPADLIKFLITINLELKVQNQNNNLPANLSYYWTWLNGVHANQLRS